MTASSATPPPVSLHRPLATLRKYSAIAIIDWQAELTYRANSIVWIAWSIFPSLTMMMVWLAAYGGHERIGGMNLNEMITYYLLITTMTIAITPNHEWETAGMIREGQITQYLLKPVDFFWFKAVCETAYQIMKTTMALPGLALLAWLFRDYLHWPRLTPMTGLALTASCALTYGLLMCFKSMLAYAAFWFGEVGGVLESWNLVMMFFAGRFVPLDVLPNAMQAVGDWLPFQWIYPFPIRIALGQVTSGQLATGLSMQLAWLLALFGLLRLVWARGVRAYEGFGG